MSPDRVEKSPDSVRIEAIARALRDAAQAKAMAVSVDQRIGERDLAELLGLHPGSLKNLRHEENSPPFYRLPVGASRISYSFADVANWVHLRRRSS